MRAVLARMRRSGEPNEDESRLAAPHLEARRREVLCAPGFWRGLAPRASGFSLLQLVRECGFLVYVLTKGPDDAPWVWGDKVSWCRAHLPGVGVIVTDGFGDPLDTPLDVDSEVAWAGYANARIRAQIEPRLQEALRARGWIGARAGSNIDEGSGH